MLYWQKIIRILILSILYHTSYAQQMLSFDEHGKATCLYQDSENRLWIGSTKGLYAYNGESYEHYEPELSVSAIYEDKQKTIWIGYENGEIRTINSIGNTNLWNIEEGFPKFKITSFVEDQIGRLWFSTYGEGIYYYEKKHLYNINQDDQLPFNEVYNLAYSTQLGSIFAATDGGLSTITINDKKKTVETLNTSNGLNDNLVDYVKEYGNQLFIRTNEGGNFLYHPNTKQLSASTLNYQANHIYTKNFHFYINENKVWQEHIGTYRYTAPQKVQSIVDSKNGETTYLGTENGLFIKDNKHQINNYKSVLPGINIVNLCETNDLLWLGTFGKGLVVWDKKTGKKRAFGKHQGLTDESILALFYDDTKVIFSTIGGLFSINLATFTFEHQVPIEDLNALWKIKPSYIYSIAKSPKDASFWLGTDGDGLIYIDNKGVATTFKNILGKEVKTVYKVASDSEGTIYFCTPNLGIFSYHNGVFENFSTQNGLTDNTIFDLKVIDNQKLILASEKEVLVFDTKSKWIFPLHFTPLNNGFQGNLNILGSNDVSSHTEILIGKDVTLFSSDIINELLPKASLKEVKLFGQKIDFHQLNTFSSEQNFFTFDLEAVYYLEQKDLKLTYFLEGFDRSWNTSFDRNIQYARLPAGKYTFHAKVIVGSYSSEEISYTFTIKPPFWQSPIFILSMLTMSFLGIYYFIKQRDKRLQKTAILEKEKITAQYNAIRSQVNPHFLFNTFNALVAVIETDQKQGVLFVEKLSDFFRNMLQHRDKETIAISEENSLLQDYVFILKQRFGENIIFNNVIQETEGNIVPLTLQILVENAVKHNIVSKSKPLYINILAEGNYIFIKNNLQPKPNNDNSTKFGLEGITKRYALLSKNEVVIEQNNDFFVVKIPIL